MTDPFQILQAVNTFYEVAFSHLITITIAILGFGGVILPIVLQFIQQRSFRLERSTLESQIHADMTKARDELRAELEKQFETEKTEMQNILKSELENMNARINEQVSAAKGGTFLLQGNVDLGLKLNGRAAMDYCWAIDCYIQGNDEANARIALENLINYDLPYLNSQSFEEEERLNGLIDTTINLLIAKNVNGRYQKAIDNISKGRNQAMKRLPTPLLPTPPA
jgi:hypothetical protein